MSYSELLIEVGRHPRQYGMLLAYNAAQNEIVNAKQHDKLDYDERGTEKDKKDWGMSRSRASQSNLHSGQNALKKRFGQSAV